MTHPSYQRLKLNNLTLKGRPRVQSKTLDQMSIQSRNRLPGAQQHARIKKRPLFTALKRNLGQGNIFTCVCLSTGGGVSVSGPMFLPGCLCLGALPARDPQTETPRQRSPTQRPPKPFIQRPSWRETPHTPVR